MREWKSCSKKKSYAPLRSINNKRKNDGGEGGRKYPGTHDDDEQKEESSWAKHIRKEIFAGNLAI